MIFNENDIDIDSNYLIKYKKNNTLIPLEIESPLLYLPFGIDKQYNNYYLKLQLRPFTDNHLKLFLKTIESLESSLRILTKKKIKSQISISNIYDPIITTKVLSLKNKIQTQVTKDNQHYNFYSIKKGTYLKVYIIVDRLWKLNEDEFTYKLKLKKIML